MDKQSLLTHWPTIREGLLTIQEKLVEQDLHFCPVEGGWPLGRILIHISSAAEYWLHSGILGPENVYDSQKNTLENYPTLDAILAYQNAEHLRTIQLIKDFDLKKWHQPFAYPDGYTYTPDWVFWHVLEHEIHHRGELSLTLGLLGKKGLDA